MPESSGDRDPSLVEPVETRLSAAEITAVWMPTKDIPGFVQPAPMPRPAEPYPFPIKMFPEYGADLPLWPQGWMSLSQLPLSDELRAALAAWNEFYDEHHHWETGWNVDPASSSAEVESSLSKLASRSGRTTC